MAKIILDADRNKDFLEEHEEEVKNLRFTDEDEEGSATRKRTIRPVYISPEEMAELEERYSYVVVQDFEDEYHMSRKDREEMKKKYSKFMELKQGFTKKIRKLDKYVKACRLCMEIINDTAETNGIIEPEKFKKMVLKGEIEIFGMKFPKFQGKGRKNMNWKYITEFILDPTLDLKLLTEYSDIDEDEIMDLNPEDAFGEEEFEEIMKEPSEEEEEMRTRTIYDPDDAGGALATRTTKKERKQFMKSNPGFSKMIKRLTQDTDKKKQNALIWQLDNEDMKWIEEYDKKFNRKDLDSMPVFKGEANNQKDVDAFLYNMEEWERENTLVEVNGRYITQEEKEELEYKQMLEESGYNLRNLYGAKEKEAARRKSEKANKKKIKTLKKMLSKLQDKDKEDDVDAMETGGVNKKKKKKKKKAKKAANQILLDATNSTEEEMKAYYKQMKKMKWGE